VVGDAHPVRGEHRRAARVRTRLVGAPALGRHGDLATDRRRFRVGPAPSTDLSPGRMWCSPSAASLGSTFREWPNLDHLRGAHQGLNGYSEGPSPWASFAQIPLPISTRSERSPCSDLSYHDGQNAYLFPALRNSTSLASSILLPGRKSRSLCEQKWRGNQAQYDWFGRAREDIRG
jgi:hypothetical protein